MLSGMRGLDGKVIVLCAGGTGDSEHFGPSMGGVTARRLASEGATLVVGDIDEAAAKRTAELIAESGGTAIHQAYDASDEASTKSLLDRAVAEYGGIDGVHFNAADAGAAGNEGDYDVVDVPLELWHRQIDVCLLGFALAARHAIPHFLERGGGSLVGTSSGAAYVGMPQRVAYSAAKAGMGAVVRHVASRWGKEGVRANTVSPGFVPSALMLADERLTNSVEATRSHRLGRAADIAAMVTFLMSEDGEWVQGQSICVDGGTVMRA
jgi:NAD(P)-dependent dehydrogenase (short-subunit alcohol dehydrogenase family)